jgi:hypothetical protein
LSVLAYQLTHTSMRTLRVALAYVCTLLTHNLHTTIDCYMTQSEATELWYTKGYTEADFIAGWVNVLKKWGKEPNLMGIDLKVYTYNKHI